MREQTTRVLRSHAGSGVFLMVGILSRLRFSLVRIATGLVGLALLSACDTAPGAQSSAGSYNGTPVAVALLVPSGSGDR